MPSPTPYDRLPRMRMQKWLERHQRMVKDRTSWMGVQIRKNPLDAWIYQEIVHEVRPDVIVEIGSFVGGSTLFFAHLMDLLEAGEVISVDVTRDRFVAEHPRIHEVTGSSADPAVQAEVRRLCEGRSVLISHDGDHDTEAVLNDLRAYADLVTVGSYFVVEDGILDLFPEGSPLHPSKFPTGPLPAIEEFLASDDRFEVDSECERYLATWNPRGYLRRVR